MSSKHAPAAVVCLAMVTFLTGINWGLPSRWADPYLFGGRAPWTGRQVMQLAGPWSAAADRGADRPQHGAVVGPHLANGSDPDRAEIVRRYRLYSEQPDEMITFRSLSGMDPTRGKFDPRLYQYGGLWIYPVGALLKAGGLLHLLAISTDIATYIDQPNQFARFYLIARLYSAFWGLVGVWIVYRVARDWAASDIAGWVAAAIFATMPVVINSAHEAKPHLAGTVLTLAAIGLSVRYVRGGKLKTCLASGAVAGTAAGMVLTGYVAFAAVGVAALTGPGSWRARIGRAFLASAVGLVVFAATNPYLPIDLLWHRELLRSNVGNYGHFYRPGVSGPSVLAAARLLVEAASMAPLAIAAAGAIWWSLRRRWPIGSLTLVAPAVVALIQFVVLAAEKPAEYARFAETIAVVVAVVAGGVIGRLRWSARERHLAGATLVAGTLLFGIRYDVNFLLNDGPKSTRLAAAEAMKNLGSGPIVVTADPAPYGTPPVDLFFRSITVSQPGVVSLPDQWVLTPSDDGPGLPSPISWANKPFNISQGPGAIPRAAGRP